MKPSLKALVLAVAVATAMIATAPSSAGASEFHTESGATLTGTQTETNELTIEGSSVTCSTVAWEGTAPAATSTEWEFSAEYSGCTAFGFAGASVNMNGCHFKVTATASVDLVCPEGKSLTISVSTIFNTVCHVDIPAQNGITNLFYYTNGPRSVLALVLALANLEYKVTKSTGLCPLSAEAEGANAEYSGSIDVIANGGATELWWE